MFRRIPSCRAVLSTAAFAVFAVLAVLAFTGADGDRVHVALATDPRPPAVESPAPQVPEARPKPTPTPLSSRLTEYHIGVRFDERSRTLEGAETVTWRNPGRQAVGEVYLHLYPNAFASDRTTFMRESGGKLRDDTFPGGRYGGMELLSVRTDDGIDLTSRVEFVRPDDGNRDDRTLARIALPEPVPPGEKTTLHLRFLVRLPPVFARMGYADDFVMAGQWFPKIAVYEPAGTRGRTDEGWNLHQYHGNSEFYSEFGIYIVNIQVPSRWLVAATGFPTKAPEESNGWKTYHFYADDVHDFAWAASPRFVYAEERFSAPGVPGVRLKLYLDPAHAHLKQRYLTAAKKSLSRYADWFGEYPYPTLSIVVPPAQAGGAGGMEYPTLITAWEAANPAPGFELERVVAHEIAHQYWYGMVATNEFEEAWLDEGFASYSEDLVMELDYGIPPNSALESSWIASPAPLSLFSWQFRDQDHYAENVYVRAKLILRDIERLIGRDRMRRVLHRYFQEWKFRHPGARQFEETLERTTGSDWSAYFEQFVYGGETVDYAVESIRRTDVSQSNAGKSASGPVYEVVVRKRGGTHPAPVTIRFRFADGSVQDAVWDGRGEAIVYRIGRSAPLEWVWVDPERSMLLENRRIDNFLKAEPDRRRTLFGTTLASIVSEWFARWWSW
ncbi:MAG: EnpEP protein [Candidatus Reconcilbacillus cellulovorans]|uniref:EnpEP protein n=1 Tax=Candidatus Reconcilbacillus cellulovorans TaxID=1906605 RepID=A0A2A6E145_9BACL|nr:MAG: EnpEP protein [Candidatus Reconcilbacillus cellulovorans]